MDPIEPWIDADAVRRMAQQLVAPSGRAAAKQSTDPGFGPGFEGFLEPGGQAVASQPSASAEAAVPQEVMPPARERAPDPQPEPPKREHQSPVASPAPVPAKPVEEVATSVPVVTRHTDDEPKPFLIKSPASRKPAMREAESSGERGPLVARMERFRHWLAEKVDARGMFILDRDGNPVIDDPSYGKLHFLARSLAQAYRPADGGAGNVHVKIGSDAYLAVVPVQAEFGALVLGMVLPQPLEASSVDSIAKALEQSLRPERR